MLVGYARVSTQDQNLDMQIKVLKEAGCKKIFAEKATGTRSDRPEYLALKEFVRSEEDTIVVYKLDRLGRSLRHLIQQMQDLKERNVGFRSIQEHIDTTTSGGKLFFHIFAAIAEFERDIIVERTKTGLEAARARGRQGGRPRKLSTSQIDILKKLYADKNNNIADICDSFKISKPTLYRLVRFNCY
jgi:DNA invertase Pin-like site-specific DNA recombinase